MKPPPGQTQEPDFLPHILALLSQVPAERLKLVKYRHKTAEEAEAYFWSQVIIGSPDECWIYNGSTTPVGNRAGDVYGLCSLNGESKRAHQWSYLFSKGEIPQGKVVRHGCDIFLCVNPRHLTLGTPDDNTRDAVERGRIPKGKESTLSRHPELIRRGEASPVATVTTLDIIIMRWLFYWGWACAPLLARIFSLTSVQVNLILRFKSWPHVMPHLDIPDFEKSRLTRQYNQYAVEKRAFQKTNRKQIEEIRLRAELGWSRARLADYYKLSPSHISRVVRRESC
jgi:hypothetical protein